MLAWFSLLSLTHSLALKVHCCIKEQVLESDNTGGPNLAPREIDVLQWSREGKTAWEISQILDISQRTVETHLLNIRKKLGVTTTTQALAKAMTLRFKEPI